MVLVRRSSSLTSSSRHLVPPSPSTQIPMGDDIPFHPLFAARPDVLSSSTCWTPSRTRRGSGVDAEKKPRSWTVMFLCALTLVSWILAAIKVRRARTLVNLLQTRHDKSQIQLDYQTETYNDHKEELSKIKFEVEKLQTTKATLEHEIRAMETLALDDVGLTPSPAQDANQEVVKGWLNYRQGELHNRITSLQQYLQEQSRKTVMEKFGAGPHKVKFTVALTDEHDETHQKSFVARMAPLDLMPHSVEYFLEMVQSGIWDNTVFLHHEKAEHVIAAAPIDFASRTIKHHHLQYLGWTGLAFPEYSKDFSEHSKYTIGFAGQGPTFYINAMDNSEAHGPGGQGHHTLPEDADPCFAEIIEGRDAIDDLIRLGMNQNKAHEVDQHPWADTEHTWIHLIKIEII